MAVFLSRAAGYRAVVKVGDRTIVVRFSNGALDTAKAAARYGVSEKDLEKAIRSLRIFGTRVVEARAIGISKSESKRVQPPGGDANQLPGED